MLNLISLTKVKTLLGIEGTDFDNKLDEFIPIVSADVRRILNDPMDKTYRGKVYGKFLQTDKKLDLGRVVKSQQLPADTYVEGHSKFGYVLSNNATDEDSEFVPTINISQWQAIARMVFYRVGNAKPVVAGEKVQSKSIGPVSMTFSVDVNRKWNYPQELIDDLGYPRLRTPSATVL